MTVQLMVFIIALLAIAVFYKNFNACVYFIVIVDIFLRVFTYLKTYILRDDAFDFLSLIPSNVLALLQSFDMGVLNDIVLALYIIVYIVFEVLIVRALVKKRYWGETWKKDLH